MAIYKCKVCAGNLNIVENESTAICDSCGTHQALPKSNSDLILNLYDRANHFRRNNEFDKAEKVYNQILIEDYTDAEAYWSLVLCKYGVEYVEDPLTKKKIPTVNRSQFTAIYDDQNYKKALEYADSYQKELYEVEAKTINEIQKGILSISQNEQPYDVFISYKETDDLGKRTRDSVLANDLYHQLTKEGFKVFFSRITLESKLGMEYEPYIFAALNSAKVMVVLGTKADYFNAVWVKNEWSRFLSIVRDSKGEKILIPAYRDMDPYNLPEEFSHLQAQDMSKLGFMQDLIRGIKKILEEEKKQVVKETIVSGVMGNVEPLLNRGFLYLEEGNWHRADEYFERSLDLEHNNARAYLGKLLVDIKLTNKEQIKIYETPIKENANFQRILRFDAAGLGKEIETLIEEGALERKEAQYQEAINLTEEASYTEAIKIFNLIIDYKDSEKQIELCNIKIKEKETENNYKNALNHLKENTVQSLEKAIDILEKLGSYHDSPIKLEEARQNLLEIENSHIYNRAIVAQKSNSIEKVKKSIELFKSIRTYKDSEQQIINSEKAIKKIKIDKKKKTVINASVFGSVLIAIIIVIILLPKVIIPNFKYYKAISLYKKGNYEESLVMFQEFKGYKESQEYVSKVFKRYSEGYLHSDGYYYLGMYPQTD